MNSSSEALLRAACCIAASDGEVNEHETAALHRLAKNIDLAPMLAEASTSPAFLEAQLQCVVDDPEAAMESLLAIAAADGTLSDAELLLIEQFALRLRIDEEQFRRLRRHAEHAAEEAPGSE